MAVKTTGRDLRGPAVREPNPDVQVRVASAATLSPRQQAKRAEDLARLVAQHERPDPGNPYAP